MSVVSTRTLAQKTWSRTFYFLKDPESSRSLLIWDCIGGVMLVVVALLTPFEAGFIDTQTHDFLWTLNIVMTAYFATDMVLQFFIPYSKRTRYGRKWVTNPKAIVKNYLKTWFCIDFISIIPFEVIVPGRSLQALRTVRLLRLIKLLRLLKGFRITRRWELQAGYSYRKTMLYWIFVLAFLIAHWIACVLGMLNRMQGGLLPCRIAGEESGTCDLTWLTLASSEDDDSLDLPAHTAYGYALHGSITILVHPHAYGPTSDIERLLFILLMFVAGFIWTQVISRSTAVTTSLDRHNIIYHQMMDDLNTLSLGLGLPYEMRVRLRKFFLRMKERDKHDAWQQLMRRMSPQLRRDASRAINMPWVRRIAFLARCRIGFLTDVAELLQLNMYTEQEHFGDYFHMYIMMAGTSSRRNRLKVLPPGAVWAEDHLLLSAVELLEDNTAVSITVTEVQSLSREDFQALLEDGVFEEERVLIRAQTVKYAFMRGVKRAAEMQREKLRLRSSAMLGVVHQPKKEPQPRRPSASMPATEAEAQLEDAHHVIQKRRKTARLISEGSRRPDTPDRSTSGRYTGSGVPRSTSSPNLSRRTSRVFLEREGTEVAGERLDLLAEIRAIAQQQNSIVSSLKGLADEVTTLAVRQRRIDEQLLNLCQSQEEGISTPIYGRNYERPHARPGQVWISIDDSYRLEDSTDTRALGHPSPVSSHVAWCAEPVIIST